MALWIGKDPTRAGKDDADQLYLVTGEWMRHIPVWRRSDLMTGDGTEDEINKHYKLIESEYDVKDIRGYAELEEPIYRMVEPAMVRVY